MKKVASRVSRSSNNSFGSSSVVLGIISMVFPSYFGVVPGIIGLIFALKQRSDNNNQWALWGMTLTIIGVLLNILDLIYGTGQSGVVVQYLNGYKA